MSKKLYTYNGQKVRIEQNSYANNGTLAACLVTPDGDLVDVITVNLNDGMQSDSMAYLDTNNHPKIEAFIKRNHLGLPMYYTQRSGFCTYPLYTLFTSQF